MCVFLLALPIIIQYFSRTSTCLYPVSVAGWLAVLLADPSINRKGASRCGLVIRSCSFGVLLARLVLILVLLRLQSSGLLLLLTLEEVHSVAFLGFVRFYFISW